MTDRLEEFGDRVRRVLVNRARRDPRPESLESAAKIYEQEAAIYARAFDTVTREELEATVERALERARAVQQKRSVRASDLIDVED